MGKKTKPLTGDRDRDMIREKWPTMSFAEKCKYRLSYYRTAYLVVIIAVLCAVFFIRDIIIHNNEETFYVLVLESELTDTEATELEDALLAYLGLEDGWDCTVEIGYSNDSSTLGAAIISTYMQNGRIDLVVASEEVFYTYAAIGYFKVLTDEPYEALLDGVTEDCFFYASGEEYETTGAVTEASFHPHENTEGSACYGIYLTDGSLSGLVLGVMTNTAHEELTVLAAQMLLEN